MKYLLLLLIPVMVFSQEPTRKGMFDGLNTKTWLTSESDTIYSDRMTVKRTDQEIGLYSMFVYGTGSTTITVQFQYFVDDPAVYSPVYNTVEGYTNGTSATVTSFSPINGFEARIDNQTWWRYNPDGFRIVFIRSSNTEVTFTFAGVKAL